MPAEVFDATRCRLGEGPLWHPVRKELFWFDILSSKLYAKADENKREWSFDEYVSAAGWIDENRLLMASETSLSIFDIADGSLSLVAPLEADNPVTRSNDGRADPYGGFWIGTMGKSAEKEAGAIYRFYKGELRQLYPNITISNAICFSPDGHLAYFTDTPTGKIMKVQLDLSTGWPCAEPEVFLDLSNENFGPDGAVIDSDGNFWNAQWGAGRVACYSSEGAFLESHSLPTPQTTCPAFGEGNMLYVTSAANGLIDDQEAGQTFIVKTNATGQKEHQVLL